MVVVDVVSVVSVVIVLVVLVRCTSITRSKTTLWWWRSKNSDCFKINGKVTNDRIDSCFPRNMNWWDDDRMTRLKWQPLKMLQIKCATLGCTPPKAEAVSSSSSSASPARNSRRTSPVNTGHDRDPFAHKLTHKHEKKKNHNQSRDLSRFFIGWLDESTECEIGFWRHCV